MFNDDSRGLSYGGAFFVLIAFGLGGLIIGSLVSIPFWMIMTGKGVMSMATDFTNPQYVNAIRVVQVISTFFGFFLPAYLTSLLVNKHPVKLLGFKGRFNFIQIGLVLAIMIAGLYLAGSLAEINQNIPISKAATKYFKQLEESYSSQVEAMATIKTSMDYLISLLIIALLPAIFEETFFRGAMQTYLTRSTKKAWIGILITSIIFSLAHFSYYGFLSRVALGILLGMIFNYTGSIWLSIFAHFFNNGLGVTQMYILSKQGKSIKGSMDDTYPIWWGIFATIVIIALFALLKRITKELKRRFPDQVENSPDISSIGN